MYACEKFHEYVYGTTFLGETDHKPLVSIHQKSLCDTTPGLQRMFLCLRLHDLKLDYAPGRFLVNADTLSRAAPKQGSSTEHEIALHVDMVKFTLHVLDSMWQKIAEETSKDETLNKVKHCINHGWNEVHPFHHFKRVVVPTSLRKHMMTIAHERHFGIVKCQSRARQVLYWPNINSNIETMVNRCEACQKHRYQQQKESLTQYSVPTLPWTKIAADLFALRNKNYLIVNDYTSNYPEVIQLRDTTATGVIMAMKSTMSRFGFPREVVSDNGPQLSSHEFSAFAHMYGFKHSTSSPYFAQNNGKAEKGVQIVKRLMTKSIESDEDIHLTMLACRCAPFADGKSPAEILFGRRLRLPNVQFHKYSEKPSNLKQKLSYDKTAKILHPWNK